MPLRVFTNPPKPFCEIWNGREDRAHHGFDTGSFLNIGYGSNKKASSGLLV
jgi:hypothetical protein